MNKLLSIFLVPVLSMLIGCGGPTREAQAALTTIAHVLVAADREIAPAYSHASDEAREHSDSWHEYDAAMSDWNNVEAALRVANAALLSTQAGLDAWRAGDESGWISTIPCLFVAVEQLSSGLEAVGLHVAEITQALALARSFTGRCAP